MVLFYLGIKYSLFQEHTFLKKADVFGALGSRLLMSSDLPRIVIL